MREWWCVLGVGWWRWGVCGVWRRECVGVFCAVAECEGLVEDVVEMGRASGPSSLGGAVNASAVLWLG